MKMELKRTVKKEVEETVELELKKFWRIRISHKETGSVYCPEKDYDHMPSEKEIAEVLLPYYERNCFATVFEH